MIDVKFVSPSNPPDPKYPSGVDGPLKPRTTTPKDRGVNASASAFLHDQDPKATHCADHFLRAGSVLILPRPLLQKC